MDTIQSTPKSRERLYTNRNQSYFKTVYLQKDGKLFSKAEFALTDQLLSSAPSILMREGYCLAPGITEAVLLTLQKSILADLCSCSPSSFRMFRNGEETNNFILSLHKTFTMHKIQGN